MSVEKDPKNASYHYHLGMAYAASGDAKRARIFLERSLALGGAFDGAAEARHTLAGLKS
jgi:Flp pilus assembly protein TadD